MADEPLFGEGTEDFRQAEWLSHKLDGRWRYDFTAKRWHGWNGVRWEPDYTQKLQGEVANLARRHVGKPEVGENLRKALLKLFNIGPIESALEALATFGCPRDCKVKHEHAVSYGTDGSDWDQDINLLGCSNGVVDLRTNTLMATPDPSTLVTKTTGRHFLPVEGPADFADRAPRFMEFLTEVMSGDVSMTSFLLLWFGASLFGTSPEQRFLLMVGIGRNGKGALKHSIMKAVGEYGVQPDANVYMRSKMGGARSDGARADLMDLKGRRVGFFSEPEGNRFNEEMLKAHTGGDLITARALYSNRVLSWEPTHSITFLVNNAPEVEDLGPSMAARVMVADFRERYDGAKEDKGLYRALEKEADGILAILCWAAAAWFRSWDVTGEGITLPPRVVEQSRAFMERNDVVAAVLNEAMVLDASARTRASILYEVYQDWHARADRSDEPISVVKFGQALERKGFRKHKLETGWYYLGIRPMNAMQKAMETPEGAE